MANESGDTQLAKAPETVEKPIDGATNNETSEVFDLDAPIPEEGDEEKETKAETDAEAKAEDETKPDADDEGSDDGEEDHTPPKRLKGAAKWRERYREAQARIAELEARPGTSPEKGDAGTDKPPQRQASPDIEAEVEKRIGKKPVESDFKDWLDFDRALRVWDTEAVIERREIKREQAARQEQSKADWREVWDEHQARVEAVGKHIPDFDEVLTSSKVEISPRVAEIALESPKSELILYHLAKNPDRAKALNGMSQIAIAKEIGRLEDRLHLPKPKTETKATPPESRLAGGAAPENDETALASWLKKTYG